MIKIMLKVGNLQYILFKFYVITDKVLDSNTIENYIIIFTKGLDDNDIDVKVSSLNSVTQFLSGINDVTNFN